MSLANVSFEVQRLWTVWPLNNAQVVRSIFRASTEQSPQESVDGVHVVPGHVFIVRHQPQAGEASQEVYVFDNVPKSADQPLWSDSLPGSSSDYTDMKAALLTVPSAPVVAVCHSPLRPHQVYLVDRQGLVEVWDYNAEKRHWKEKDFFRLKTEGPVASAVYIPKQQCLVWAEREESSSSLTLYSVKQQLLLGDRDHSIHSCCTVLSGVTEVTLSVLENCIHIAPQIKKFCYFWCYKEEILMPYLWETPLPLSVSQLKVPCSHRRITLQLVTPLSKAAPPPSGCVVATTVHPVTHQLIVLTDRGIVSSVIISDGPRKTFQLEKIVKLVDFEEHHPFFSAQRRISEGGAERRGSVQVGSLEIFIYQLYVGIINMGVVRLYEVHCGEMLWSYDEHESTRTRLWRMEGRVPAVGLWTEDSLWIIRSAKVTEQAEFLVKGQFPVTTNADGTTPWDYLASGPKFAAQLCKKWNLKLWCSKYALDEIYEIVAEYKQKTSSGSGNTDIKRPHISEDLLDMALSGLQNPGLVLALLADIPECQHAVVKRIQKFLDDYKSTQDQVSPLQTPLNREIVRERDMKVQLVITPDKEMWFSTISQPQLLQAFHQLI